MLNIKNLKTINNWSVILRGMDEYTPPELMITCFTGHLEGTPEDMIILTSALSHWEHRLVEYGEEDTRIKQVFVTASGSMYLLGTVDPVYEEKFPDARTRLWKSLEMRVERH